jgi:hypothetical protein
MFSFFYKFFGKKLFGLKPFPKVSFFGRWKTVTKPQPGEITTSAVWHDFTVLRKSQHDKSTIRSM